MGPKGSMGAVGRALRLAVSATLLTILLLAQLGGHDDWFPLGMLGQYGVARDPDGEVLDTYVVGRTADGTDVPVPLRADSAGITRVELELALPGIREDPALLERVALAYEQRHPGTDLTALEVRQRVHTLRDGARSGPPQDRLVVRWDEP